MGIIFLVVFLLAASAILFYFYKKSPADSNNSNHRNDDRMSPSTIASILQYSSIGCLVVAVIVVVIGTYQTTDSGTIKVGRIFGKIQKVGLKEGLSFPVNPIISWETVNIQRNSIIAEDGKGKPGMTSTTADNNTAEVDANFSYSTNPDYAWWVLKYLGSESKFKSDLLERAAQSATRDGLGYYKLEDAQVKQRDRFENTLTEKFRDNIFKELPKQELTEVELKKVFIVYPTQLMSIQPDDKVANALAEKKATEILLQQQTTLDSIEGHRANRRTAEGVGIKNLFAELPKNYSASDVAIILEASASKERADAVFKAVTDGKVSFGMFEGSAARVNSK